MGWTISKMETIIMDQFELVSQYAPAGHRRIGQRLQRRQPASDISRRHRFRQNLYDDKCHPAIK